MALDTSLLQPTLTSGTTSSTGSTTLTSTSSSKLGLLSDPTYYTYGTGALATASTIGSVLLGGVVVVGVGLLSYAITKAALEP